MKYKHTLIWNKTVITVRTAFSFSNHAGFPPYGGFGAKPDLESVTMRVCGPYGCLTVCREATVGKKQMSIPTGSWNV